MMILLSTILNSGLADRAVYLVYKEHDRNYGSSTEHMPKSNGVCIHARSFMIIQTFKHKENNELGYRTC